MTKTTLNVLTLEQNEEWDRLVRSFSSHDVYYLSGYVRAFELHGDGEPLLFYYDDGQSRGMNVAMKRDIATAPQFSGSLQRGTYFDLATPYGYGGWIIEGDSKHLMRDYEAWCVRNRIVSEFVRFHPMLGNQVYSADAYDVIPLGQTIAMDLSDSEEIWNNLSSKNRNVIRKAIKNNIEVYNGRYPDIFHTFKAIYNATMDRDEADPYYYFEDGFYESLLNDLPANAQVFYAQKDGVVIAASIMLECNGFMNYHLSGSLREYSRLAATNLLLYKAALWGSAHGFKTLYLGGGVGSGEDSLFKFKRAFYKGEGHQFYIGKKIIEPEAYKELANMRGQSIVNTSYFPIYRG